MRGVRLASSESNHISYPAINDEDEDKQICRVEDTAPEVEDLIDMSTPEDTSPGRLPSPADRSSSSEATFHQQIVVEESPALGSEIIPGLYDFRFNRQQKDAWTLGATDHPRLPGFGFRSDTQ